MVYIDFFSDLFTLEAVENPNKYLQRGYVSTFFAKNEFIKRDTEELGDVANSLEALEENLSEDKSIVLEDGKATVKGRSQ